MTDTARPDTFFSTARGRELLTQFDAARVPGHVAIIMDGNGRWASKRGLPKVAGHRAGARATEEAIGTALETGVRCLTLYSFSSENWRRPADEVGALMGLFVEVLKAKMDLLRERDVRVHVIGRLDEMPVATATAFREAMAETAGNDALHLVIALNYGSRNEIVDAVRAIAAEVAAGDLDPAAIDEESFSAHLSTAGLPDPDLLVRTSGELRISNFLLWQIAYTELYVTETLWPDFDRDEFLAAIIDYQHRERRFGGR
ncbi:MAG: isoprenyl transferase [Coriobacteriia bacterium]|nr:isoprenyl transferase [Coriobacteriia bacterium]